MTPGSSAAGVLAATIALAAGALVVGCSADADGPRTLGEKQPPPLSWVEVGILSVAAPLGRTATVTVDVPSGQRFVAIRVRPRFDGLPPTSSSVCYQLDSMTAAGSVWIDNSRRYRDWGPACKRCRQRTMSLPWLGTFAFPNDGLPLGDPGVLRFRVVLRDCATGVAADASLNPDLPPRVMVERAVEPEDPAAIPSLCVALVEPHPVSTRAAAEAALAHLADHGFVVRLRERASSAELGPREVPIYHLPCSDLPVPSESPDLLGVSPRIPGGLSDDPSAADGVYITSAGCGSEELSASDRARLIAHELGHFLGLYHSDEVYGSHRAPSGIDLMHSGVLGKAGRPEFTARQLAAIRAHPLVWLRAK